MANITHFDLLTREIDIKGLSQVIIVMTDNNSSKIKFIYDVTDDFSDVATKINNGTYNVWVKFLSPSDYMSKTLISDITYTEGSLSFVWNIPKEALVEKGSLQFAIEILGTDFRLSTKASNIYIYETVNKDDVTMTPAEEAWMIQYDEKFLGYISQMDGKFDTAINTATEKASQASQSATDAQEAAQEAKTSLQASQATIANAILKTAQTLTDAEQAQARANIGAAQANSIVVDRPTTWAEVQRIVRAGAAPSAFAIGDQLTCKRGTQTLVWDVLDFDHDVPVNTSMTHSMTLQLHDYINAFQYDAPEALYYAAEALPAGTYRYTLGTVGGWQIGDGVTRQFTLTTSVPKGGQIRIDGDASTPTSSAMTYASKTVTNPIETVSVTAGSGGTALDNLNHVQRIAYGSNNWQASALRQWLNSGGAAGAWWAPASNYDRPPAAAASMARYLKGLDTDFLGVAGKGT